MINFYLLVNPEPYGNKTMRLRTIFIALCVICVITLKAYATSSFKFPPDPKYAVEGAKLTAGIYLVLYPRNTKTPPLLIPREPKNSGVVSSYKLILVLSTSHMGWGDPFLADIKIEDIEWRNTREGESVNEQFIEISETAVDAKPQKKIVYYHPRAEEFEKKYCIHRFISTGGKGNDCID